ncbi:glycosyltransferase [Clostridium perfringens]
MKRDIVVSISCITYNHENYIAKAIESFLAQKTNFKFEILIHDDASTDNTQNIIRDYHKRYPEIIKPILQKENQYSRGVKRISYLYNEKRAKGKYIACCEGDDYWIDEYKLQKQVDFMEKNKECSMCFHAASIFDDKKMKVISIQRAYDKNCIAKLEDIIMEGGDFCVTYSILYPKKLTNDLPPFYMEAHVGDYPLQMILASKGFVYYMNDNMSVYRINVKNSWTSNSIFSGNINEKFIKNNNADICLLNKFNEFTELKYSNIVNKKILKSMFNTEVIKGNLNEIRSQKYLSLYKNLNTNKKIKIYIRSYFPLVYEKLYKIKRLLK